MLHHPRPPATAQRPHRGSAWTQLLIMLGGAAVLALIFYPMVRGSGSGALQEGSIKWQTDLPGALTQAKGAGKPVLIDFSATWCPPCQKMKSDVWPDDAVGHAVMAGFIPVFMDVDERGAQAAGQRYGVESIPTIIVADADGKVLRSHTGFMSRDELLAFLAEKPR